MHVNIDSETNPECCICA